MFISKKKPHIYRMCVAHAVVWCVITDNIWVSVWWKTKNQNWGIYTSHIHWFPRGIGTPKDRDKFNRREVCECDEWVCDLEVIGTPSKKKRSVSRWVCKNKILINSLWTLPRRTGYVYYESINREVKRRLTCEYRFVLGGLSRNVHVWKT